MGQMHEIFDQFKQQLPDIDPVETQEWVDSLDAVVQQAGTDRARFLLFHLLKRARQLQVGLPNLVQTRYINTISPEQEPFFPGDEAMEHKVRRLIRWNALAMVLRANTRFEGIGGHLSTYASAASLYEVGFNHFFRGNDEATGDQVFFQGHAAPGIYARAFLEGRISEEQLDHFRREALWPGGLSSYPHPRLMPEFWQFPTVSMGLGPMAAIYQARFNRYLNARDIADTANARVWAFLGDGEMDEPEALGALPVAAREGLDNLTFVVNCNLQRLDGPVRGNGKIIQELEAAFLGAGWNVIKVIWGYRWDPLLARDTSGLLRKRMEEAVDGEYQNFKAKGGAYTREHFFGKYPESLELVANMSDDEIALLNRGGHDSLKVWNAYAAAVAHKGRPTVILAKTVKGYGMGKAGEALNVTHQQKKMDDEALKAFRDRFNIPVTDEEIGRLPFFRPAEDSPEMQYLKARRKALGGSLPVRRDAAPPLAVPPLEAFKSLLDGSEGREISTTMAFVRILTQLLKDKNIGSHVVPIVPDEARTFGMEGLFRQVGIYSSVGQLYTPQDADQLMSYREDKKGQILEEGINEAGAFCSWMAAGTAYANHGISMIPMYIFYSMFGFQRIGDFAWAAGDMQARGFLLGATAGRTTLAGEGLQHQDGHSHLLASTIPNCIAYDPCFAYELAVIMQDGLRRMYAERESVFYYITCMNENYAHPAMPKGVEQGILRGMYLLHIGGRGAVRATLLGSGTILREVLAAAQILESEFGVPADVMSVTSFSELRRDALAAEREAMLKPGDKPRQPWVRECLAGRQGPFIAATDYMKTVADQIRQWVPGRYVALGTDGFGRSDSRAALRGHFEVDRHWIVVAALKALADDGRIDRSSVTLAMKKFGIDPAKPDPLVT
jgi:pyruvate dehydrogenase E1 component